MTRSNIDEDKTNDGRAEAPASQDAYAPDPSIAAAQKDPPPLPRKRVFFFALLLIVALIAYGGYEHFETYEQATTTQQEAADFTPEVQTITAKADGTPIAISLPGQTEPFDQATIYPRATGYIAERRVDIGSRVKKGDLLIRIAAPDLDQQLAQARGQLAQTKAAQAQAQASLDQAKANLNLANVTFKRTNKLTQQGYETVQNNDNQQTQVASQQAAVETAEAGIKVAAANTQAQQATVDRLVALTSFEEVRAPFDGIVTTRGVDIGDLVNADVSTGTPLFTVASDKVLRVAINVPQTNALSIHDGLTADVTLPQLPNKAFTGKIARSSVALQNSSRVLDTEVDVENPTGELRPGAFVTVTFHVPRERPNVVLPAEAMIFNQHGLQVATMQDDEAHLQNVAIYRDFGKTVELRDGLNGGEQVIVNPPVDLADHQKVKVKERPPEEQAKK
jgi:RND family efflux transporter MFP subunit